VAGAIAGAERGAQLEGVVGERDPGVLARGPGLVFGTCHEGQVVFADGAGGEGGAAGLVGGEVAGEGEDAGGVAVEAVEGAGLARVGAGGGALGEGGGDEVGERGGLVGAQAVGVQAGRLGDEDEVVGDGEDDERWRWGGGDRREEELDAGAGGDARGGWGDAAVDAEVAGEGEAAGDAARELGGVLTEDDVGALACVVFAGVDEDRGGLGVGHGASSGRGAVEGELLADLAAVAAGAGDLDVQGVAVAVR
jgi:hypothetical protein